MTPTQTAHHASSIRKCLTTISSTSTSWHGTTAPPASYGSMLDRCDPAGARPAVAPSVPLARRDRKPPHSSMGWEMRSASISAIRPRSRWSGRIWTFTSVVFLDATRGPSERRRGPLLPWPERRRLRGRPGSLTDHDIRAREFITPATEYADFDNNGYASGFVWRPGPNAYFYYNNDLPSRATTSVQFGTTGDIPVRHGFQRDGILTSRSSGRPPATGISIPTGTERSMCRSSSARPATFPCRGTTTRTA